jgi:hypothetical protein
MYDIYLCCFVIKPKRSIRMWSAYADGIVHRGLYVYTPGPYEFMIRIWSGAYAYGLNIRQSLSLVQCEYGRTRLCGVYALFYILECGISVGKMGCASF